MWRLAYSCRMSRHRCATWRLGAAHRSEFTCRLFTHDRNMAASLQQRPALGRRNEELFARLAQFTTEYFQRTFITLSHFIIVKPRTFRLATRINWSSTSWRLQVYSTRNITIFRFFVRFCNRPIPKLFRTMRLLTYKIVCSCCDGKIGICHWQVISDSYTVFVNLFSVLNSNTWCATFEIRIDRSQVDLS